MLNNYFIQEKIILPLSDIITGNSVSKYLKFLQQSKYWSREQIDDFQNKRLRLLIAHAYENVPYYRDVMLNLGLTPKDIQTKEDLYKLPIITKSLIRSEGIERFTAKNFSNSKVIKNSSSGSTGEPFVFLTTKEAYSINIAANLRGWYNMGYRLGDKYIKFSGQNRGKLIKRLQDKITMNMYLSSSNLDDNHIYDLLVSIEKYKPKIIRCYPDPLLIIARFKKCHPEFKYTPLAIATTGSTLSISIREEIESAFNCKIFDSYSCEGNSCVFECNTHQCYHSSEEYGITEVINKNGEPIKNGEGVLVSTDLWNFAHPFIRYNTEDIVSISSDNCDCGRDHLRINNILGRSNDIITLESGKIFTSHDFSIFILHGSKMNNSIDQFQIKYSGRDKLEIILKVNDKFTDDISSYLKNYWEDKIGFTPIINKVEKIPLMQNGKHKYLIDESKK